MEFDPKTQKLTLRCSGGVTIKSDQLEARAERLTIRDGKLLFEGGVGLILNESKPSVPAPPVKATGIRIHYRTGTSPPQKDRR